MKTTLLLFLCLLLGFEASAKQPKLSPDIKHADLAAVIPVIVQYEHEPNDADHQMILTMGGQLKGKLKSVKAGAYKVPGSALASIAADPNVRYVSLDRPVHAKLDYSTAAVNAAVAWRSGYNGTGIGVAVIDSGTTPVGDFTDKKNRLLYTQDFVYKDGKDQYGHGEHVAGIIAASGKGSNCSHCNRALKGVAPDANLINFRVLDENGQGSDSDVIAAVEQAIRLKDKYNIRVINLSLGRPIYESYVQDPLCQAVEAAWKAGIVVVVAAGNDGRDNSMGTNGYGTITAPGNDPYVITVGAMKTMNTYDRSDDLIASYSSKGPTLIDHIAKPDILAPGNRVVSLRSPGARLAQDPQTDVPVSYYQTVADAKAGSKASDAYLVLNGTSMAAPVVSGAVADLLEAEPNLTPDQVKARLMKTASKTFPQTSVASDPVTGEVFTSHYDIFTVGAGYLDVAAALANKDVASGAALSPQAILDPASGNIYLASNPSSVWNDQSVDGARAVWGTQTVWGTAVIDGTRGVWGNRGAWGTNGVWSTSGLSAARAVWGTNGVSNSSSLDGTRGVWGNSAVAAESTSVTLNGEN